MIKTGKNIKYVNSNNFLNEATEENFVYDTFSSEIPDPIRYFSKNYWTIQDNNIVLARKVNNNVMFTTEMVDSTTILLKANKSKFYSDSINQSGILERTFDKDKWLLFLNNTLPDQNNIYYDYTFNVADPIDTKQDSDSNEKNLKYIKKESKYNFYSENYESLTGDRVFDVTTLPYIFALLNNPSLDTRTKEENLVLTLGGLIPDNYAESLFLEKDYTEIVKSYFNIYSDTYRNTDTRAVIEELSNYSKTIRVSNDKLNLLNNLSFVPFPYHMDIKFSNLSNYESAFTHKLNKFGSVKKDLENYILYNFGTEVKTNFITDSDIIEEKTISEYDVKEWINLGTSGSLGSEVGTLSPVEYGKLVDYIKSELKPLNRKYDELHRDTKFSQLLFYKIEKRLSGFNSNNIIQTFWIDPNTSDVIRIIDTQIKYGTDYYYTINAYMMVLGNMYSYERYNYSTEYGKILEKSDVENGLYRIKVKNNRSYKMFVVPYSKFVMSVNENPLTRPVVMFQKDGENLRININNSENSSYDDIKIIENKDFNILENIKKSQDNADKDKIFCSINNESKNTLQIYKTTVKPINYLSFQGKLYKTLLLSEDKTFTDKIIPGIKYYYTFRYLNNHDAPSEVSKVYEVILKNEDGYMYLETTEVNLESNKENIPFKPFKKYLLIRPNMMQSQPQLDKKIRNSSDITLGPKGESVWGKEFILRITSKKTNRVIEFNLKSDIERK